VTSFNTLGLAETVLRALRSEEYETPTPIQEQAIPILLKGHDLLGIAQTGTGKTCAFATPLISRMLDRPARMPPRHVRVLVLAPTRELAAQITDSFRAYGRFANITVATVVGGVSAGPQIKSLHRGLDVLVATPGRLLDHMDAGHLKLDKVEAVVLDEADHMFDLGFIVPIRRIMAKLPKVRQSLFFSATMPKEISALASEFLHNPQRVEVAPVATTAERVRQEAIMLTQAQKLDMLSNLLSQPAFERTIVFTRTKRGADRVSKHLDDIGVRSFAIHGNKSQGQRVAALDAFKGGRARVLVATDIAARGIDVSGVSHVINYELPEVAESYVHRIGRTARAGAEGIAISLVAPGERALMRAIEKLIRQPVEVTKNLLGENFDATDGAPERKQRGGRQGQPAGRSQKPAHSQRAPRQGKPEGRREGRPQDYRGERQHEGRPSRPQEARVSRPAASQNAQPPRHQTGAQRPAPIEITDSGLKRRTRPGSRARARMRAEQGMQGASAS
jgi:ATP-dependent RNA helicase RhlE